MSKPSSNWPGRPSPIGALDCVRDEQQDANVGKGEDERFDECLKRFLRGSGRSQNELAKRSWLDISYVSRLVNVPLDPLNPRPGRNPGSRQPSRDVVIRLGMAMGLPIENMDELLLSAGYAPLVR